MIDWTSFGSGGAGTVMGALVAFFGLKSRMDKMENKQDNFVSQALCKERHGTVKDSMDDIKVALHELGVKLDKISTCLTAHVAKDEGGK